MCVTYRSEFVVSEGHTLNIILCKGTSWIKVRKTVIHMFTGLKTNFTTKQKECSGGVYHTYHTSPEGTSSKSQLCFPDCVIVWVTCGY